MNIAAKLLKRLAGALIRGYQLLVSPFLPGACRFHPTCSEYSREVVSRFGVLKGGRLALGRIARCHPWGEWGEDPVPETADAEEFENGKVRPPEYIHGRGVKT